MQNLDANCGFLYRYNHTVFLGDQRPPQDLLGGPRPPQCTMYIYVDISFHKKWLNIYLQRGEPGGSVAGRAMPMTDDN